MYEETKRSKVVKYILIGIALLFVFVMLVLPLVTVICEAFKSGAEVFWQAVSDDYTVKAIVLTVEATVFAVLFNTVFGILPAWSITKFRFKGKKLLTTLIDLPVTVSPIIAGPYICTYIRQTKPDISAFKRTWNQGDLCRSGNYPCNRVCNIPVHLEGAYSRA